MKYQVVLIDDHPILTDGLKMLINKEGQFEVIATFQSCEFALAFFKTGHKVDLAIIDYAMPDMNGVVLMRYLKQLKTDLKVIILSMHDEPTMIQEALREGVDGYILKNAVSDELSQAMTHVLNGRSYWSHDVAQKMLSSLKQPPSTGRKLTDRESEVLKCIVKELTNREIATQLFISERTVEVHRKNLMRKLNCSSTVGLIKYAFHNGLV